MKRLLSPVVVGLLALLSAATPASAQYHPHGCPPPPGCPHGPVVISQQPCPEEHKVCVPVPDKLRRTKVIYDCRTVDFCLPKCPHPLFGRGCDGCGHCGGCGDGCAVCGECEKPRCRKVLIKRLKVEECDTYRCEVQVQPCPAPCPTPYPPLPPGCTIVPVPQGSSPAAEPIHKHPQRGSPLQ